MKLRDWYYPDVKLLFPGVSGETKITFWQSMHVLITPPLPDLVIIGDANAVPLNGIVEQKHFDLKPYRLLGMYRLIYMVYVPDNDTLYVHQERPLVDNA